MVTRVDFYPKDYNRRVAGDQLILKNRYFEQNPVLSTSNVSLLARPGLKYLTTVGSGPIRGVFSEEGLFNGDLFVASGDSLYRLSNTLDQTLIISGLNDPERGAVNMTATAPIGDVPAYLFFADGRNLYVYSENGAAHGTLSGTAANNDVVRIGDIYYKFTNGSVNAGTPAGTSGNPWLVKLGLTGQESMINLSEAVDASGTGGTTYSTSLTANNVAKTASVSGLALVIDSTLSGALGNAVVTTETGSGLSWASGTLTGGGDPYVRQVDVPEDQGAFDVATINSFVIVLPTQEGDFQGRFYWIEPGENTIDPLNFATAERSPDGVLSVEVVGDQFWLPGAGSTEVWYVSTDPINRMQRLQGVVFDRGTWGGTAVAIHESLIVCDSTGAVFDITGGRPQRISTPDIEEQIRRAIEKQLFLAP